MEFFNVNKKRWLWATIISILKKNRPVCISIIVLQLLWALIVKRIILDTWRETLLKFMRFFKFFLVLYYFRVINNVKWLFQLDTSIKNPAFKICNQLQQLFYELHQLILPQIVQIFQLKQHCWMAFKFQWRHYSGEIKYRYYELFNHDRDVFTNALIGWYQMGNDWTAIWNI